MTFGSGLSGVHGVVSASNSLVGSSGAGRIGYSVTPLDNGNYFVSSPDWNNVLEGANKAGAVTFGNGTSGVTGVVSAENSLVGNVVDQQVGAFGTVHALPSSSYLIRTPKWDNVLDNVLEKATDAGAVTFGNGTTGVKGGHQCGKQPCWHIDK